VTSNMNISLYYEGVMGLFLGKKAHHQCAGEEANEKARNKRLNAVARAFLSEWIK